MINTDGLKNIVEESKDYLDTKIELTKLTVAEKSSEAISSLMMFFIVGTVVLLLFICISLFIGFVLSEYFDSFSKGFGALSAVYFLIACVIIMLRNKLLTIPIQNRVIRKFFEDE